MAKKKKNNKAAAKPTEANPQPVPESLESKEPLDEVVNGVLAHETATEVNAEEPEISEPSVRTVDPAPATDAAPVEEVPGQNVDPEETYPEIDLKPDTPLAQDDMTEMTAENDQGAPKADEDTPSHPEPAKAAVRFGHSHSSADAYRCECEDLLDAIAAGPTDAEVAALEAAKEPMFESPFARAASVPASLSIQTSTPRELTSQEAGAVLDTPSGPQSGTEATFRDTISLLKTTAGEDGLGDNMETPKSRYRIPARRAKTEDSVIPLYTDRQTSEAPETPTNPNAYRPPHRRQKTVDREGSPPSSEQQASSSSSDQPDAEASASPLSKSFNRFSADLETGTEAASHPHVKKDSLISDPDQGQYTKSPVDIAQPELPPTVTARNVDDAASSRSATPSQPAAIAPSSVREQIRSRRDDVPRRLREPSLERAMNERERHHESAILTDDEDIDPRAAFRARYISPAPHAPTPPPAPTAPHSPTMRSARAYAEPPPSDNPPRYYPPPTAAHLPYPGYYAQHRHNLDHAPDRDLTPPYHNALAYRGMEQSYASDSSGSRGLAGRDDYLRGGGSSRYHQESDDPADLLGKIASTIPDIQRLMHRYYETQGKLSEREERMREAEQRQEDTLRKQELKLIDQSNILSELRHELESTRDRHESNTNRLRDQILEAELKRKDFEAAKAQSEAQIEALEKERQDLHRAIPAERERMMQEFEEWKANAKAEGEAQQMAIATAMLDKEKEYEQELTQKLEAARLEYEAKVTEVQGEFAKSKADHEAQFVALQEESATTKASLEAQISSLQTESTEAMEKNTALTGELEALRNASEDQRISLQALVDSEREQHAASRTKWDAEKHQLNEDWAAEMEALKNALHEEHDTYKNETNEAHTKALLDTKEVHIAAIDELNESTKQQIDAQRDELTTAHTAELDAEKARCRLEIEDVHRRWIEDKEKFDKTLGELRSVMQNIGNERGRLQKLIDGTGGFSELKSKGDAF